MKQHLIYSLCRAVGMGPCNAIRVARLVGGRA